MEKPDYNKILEGKIEHYGETKAAYQFTAEELARKEVEFALKENNFWFDKFNDRHPDEVREIIDSVEILEV